MERGKMNRMRLLIEKILLKEAFNTFIVNNSNSYDDAALTSWYESSTNFVRIWINYLSDNELEELFERKMKEQDMAANVKGSYGI